MWNCGDVDMRELNVEFNGGNELGNEWGNELGKDNLGIRTFNLSINLLFKYKLPIFI